jgi:hypothetical protein
MRAARGTRPSLAAPFGGGAAALAALAVAPLACGSEPPASPVSDIAAAACAEYVAAYETAVSCRRADIVPPGQSQVEVPAQQLRTRRLFEERCRTWLAAPGSGITPAVLHACSARVRTQCLESFAFVEGMFVNPWRSRNVLCDIDIPGTLPDGARVGTPRSVPGAGATRGRSRGRFRHAARASRALGSASCVGRTHAPATPSAQPARVRGAARDFAACPTTRYRWRASPARARACAHQGSSATSSRRARALSPRHRALPVVEILTAVLICARAESAPTSVARVVSAW